MPLQLTNTLTRKKQVFEPIDPQNVRLYVCGPTVYDFAHIGNARPVVVFDVLFRLLRQLYGAGHVTYARNITDVDDKIINAARESGEPIDAITARTTKAFHDDMAALGALEPTVEPRATQHIPQMIALIERLIERGHAYSAPEGVGGHVLFSVPSDEDYGVLSRRNRDEMIAGARVDVAPYKKDPADFVLWKPSTAEQPGWDSPWGRGRPGWHIECSAMSAAHLGETFDIHGGGQDLIFPHHENELAQSTCGTDGKFARTWMHNGYVIVGGEKMSKSLGNFFTVRQLLEEDDWPGEAHKKGEAIRLTLLSAHYRQPLDFTRDKLADAKAQLDRLYGALRHASDVKPAKGELPAGVVAALKDDLNTPLALAQLHELAGELNKAKDDLAKADLGGQLRAGCALLGLLDKNAEDWFQGGGGDQDAAEIESLITARNDARKAKNFAEADRIRDELAAKGIVLEDSAGGTTWRRAG
ncbi:MAG: cysteine--tRNA ligase [Kiloniellales bacterium]